MRYLGCIFLLLATLAPLRAQEPAALYVLVPIALADPVPGAYGSVWESELWVHNGGTAAAGNVRGCQIGYEGQQCPLPFAPGVTTRAPKSQLQSVFGAVLMYIGPTGALDDLTLSSRLFETSRHTQPLGVEIPVVREGEFFTNTVRFIGIDGSSANRVALRVYHTDRLERRSGGAVQIQLFRSDGSLITSKNIPLQYGGTDWDPGYAAILDLRNAVPELNGIDRYDVSVTPLKAGMQFYALVSSTNLETQQVLVVTARQLP